MADSATPLRPFARPRVPLPTGDEAADFDRHAIDELGVPHHTLMENAGRSAALLLNALYPHGRVVALVGTGNNGGDALVVLRNLACWGREVRAILVADRALPETVLHTWEIPSVRDGDLDDSVAWDSALAGAAVVVDGLLGTGLNGPPRERQARAIDAANRSGIPVLALDAPSGADANTGATPGPAIKAEVTIAFGWPKLGCLLHPARAHAGRLMAVEIGFPEPGADRFLAESITPAWAQLRRPAREVVTHKNAVGSLLIVAGREGMAGAAVLAARAAIRSGVGYVRMASSPANREILQESVPDAVFVDRSDDDALAEAVAAAQALVLGPGMGTESVSGAIASRILPWAGDRPVLLDADALTTAAAATAPSIAQWAERGPTVVTPHPGEMARLVGSAGVISVGNRVGAVREYAAGSGAVTLLKGAPSLVAHPDGRLLVDSVGSSDLAAAGMGDVLSGVIGAFLAQGVGPLDAAGSGLYTSGRAAAMAGKGAGLSPTDVVEQVPQALMEWGPGSTDVKFPFLIFDQDPPR